MKFCYVLSTKKKMEKKYVLSDCPSQYIYIYKYCIHYKYIHYIHYSGCFFFHFPHEIGRFLGPQEAPVRECHITLDLLDQDTVTGADQIYAPKVLSLEPLVAATYFARAWTKIATEWRGGSFHSKKSGFWKMVSWAVDRFQFWPWAIWWKSSTEL